MNHMLFGRHHHKVHAASLLLVAVVVILAASSGWSPKALADYNHNPVGYANYCRLSGSNTIIYGWAHDPDALSGGKPQVIVRVGTQSQTVNSDVAGYHDSAINKYLAEHRPNGPQGNTYGFTATFSGLYKGNTYAISGTVPNYGSGDYSPPLNIDTTSSQADGISVSNLFTASKTLPDACLATAPAPAPAPTPTPTPTPVPTPKPSPSGKSGTSSNSSNAGNSDTGEYKSAANGSVAAGTLSAVVTLPVDGAASVYLLYGTEADTMTDTSDDGAINGDKATVEITGLEAKTKYYYQIVRTNADGEVGTSPTADFTTGGYTITLHFTDANKKPVAGIEGIINDRDTTTAKSNEKGEMSFYNLDPGIYTVNYKYKNLNYTKEFDTDAADDDESTTGKTVVLGESINVSTLKGGSAKPAVVSKKHSSAGKIILLLFLIAVVGGIIVWVILRRRRAAQLAGDYNGYYVPPPAPATPVNVVDTAPKPHHSTHDDEPEQLEHVGESLREMVVRSMHEEAQKRKDTSPHDQN